MSTARMILRAKLKGARWPNIIIREARRAGIPVSLGFALVEQESGFTNVFGHDPTIFVGAGKVTRAKYAQYKAARGHTHMQGVGPCQLTWWATQDRADKLGGCWVPQYNIRVAFETLAGNIKQHGLAAGIAAYNGTGPAAAAYSRSVQIKARKWHEVLT